MSTQLRDIKTDSLAELTGWIELFQRGELKRVPECCSWCGGPFARKDPTAYLPVVCLRCDFPEDRTGAMVR